MSRPVEYPVGTLVLQGGTVVTGEGSPPIEDGAVVAAGGVITAVRDGPVDPDDPRFEDATVVDVGGDVVMPGIVNSHAHQLVDTPFSASAAESTGMEAVRANQTKHLVEGCTTVVNVDSFALRSEVDASTDGHPLKVELASCPTPTNFEAADLADGVGLTDEARANTIPDAVEAGTVLLGEVGAGSTLAGGAQRYLYVPRAVEERTGEEITPAEAGKLVDAVIGKHADPDNYDAEAAAAALAATGLDDEFTPEALRDLIMDVTWPSVEAALVGFEEVGDYAEAYGVPMMVHNSAPSRDATEALAARDLPLIAGHSNHTTFTGDEAIEFARILRSYDDVTVEINSWDLFEGGDRLGDEQAPLQETFFRFIEEGLADTLATDYAGGGWHGMLLALQAARERDAAPLAELLALVTGNVAEAIPAIGADRGTLDPGKAADLLVVDRDDISVVRRVYVDGDLVVEDGEPTFEA